MSGLQLYYDGGCPVCSRGIAFYPSRPGTERFEWVGVTGGDAELGSGFEWLGWLLAVPPFGILAEWAYRGFPAGRNLWR